MGNPLRYVRRMGGKFLRRLPNVWLGACIAVGRRLSERRLRTGRIRTLWGVTPILTLPLKARCDQALGWRSESAVFTNYYITKAFTWNFRWACAVAVRVPGLYGPFCKFLLGVALLRYDVFHYFADRGLLAPTERFGINAEELEILHQAGKRVYVYAYGADVRTRQRTLDLGPWNFCRDCDTPGKHCVCDDTTGAAIMARISKHVTATVSLGDMLTYMPGAHHLAYWPIDTDANKFVGVGPQAGPLKIAHAPNHSHFKGTRYLEASIERLRQRGHAIEFVKVSGVPNTEVLRLFADADVVADQFIGGAYGYAALEALARGKPVLTYVRHSGLIEAADECPFLNATPDTLDAVLIWCCENRDRLPAIGAKGRAYVERWHSIPAVASRLARLYLETAGFPAQIEVGLRAFVASEAARRDAVRSPESWRHPWRVADNIHIRCPTVRG